MERVEVVERIRKMEREASAAVEEALSGTREEQTMALSALSVALCRAWLTVMPKVQGRPLTHAELVEVVRSAPWENHAKTAMVGAAFDAQFHGGRP